MADLFSQVGSFLSGRIDHVPDVDVPSCLETFQTLTGDTLTVAQWRAFEQVQTLYLTHRILKQATPNNIPGIAGTAIAVGEASTESSIQSGIANTP